MKKILILLAFAVTSCGALENYSASVTTGYYSGDSCVRGEYYNGIYGFGFYDCYGRLIYSGAYNPYLFNNFYNYGPRIIITPKRRTTVRGNRGGRTSTPKSTGGRRGGGTVRPKPTTPKVQ